MAISVIVNNWFRDRIANGAVARDTEAYNQVAEALPDLIERLAPAVPASTDPLPDPAAGKKG